VALAAAAAQELLVWPLLALAVSLAGAGGDPARLAVLGAAAIAGAVLLARVTPARLLPAGVLLAAALTELAGLHLVLGAFLFGAALPPARRRAALAPGRVRATALALTLPAAFAVPALRVDVWALGAAGLGLLAVVVGVAVAAKLGSAALAAAAAGLSRREALEVGVLMNARGLVELVVLSVGVQAGLLGDRLFTVMVLMALVTTFAAGPLVTPRAPRASGGGAWRARPRAGTPPPPSSPAARSA